MPFVTLDFETYSECDIRVHGLERYLSHPTTSVQMLAWAIDRGPKRLWIPFSEHGPEPMPAELAAAIDGNYLFLAHEAEFEIGVWRRFMVKRYGWRDVPSRSWRCIAAKAAYAALPRSLARISSKLDLGEDGKDKEGHKIMMQLCKPQRGKRNRDPDKFARFCEYCMRDVAAEEFVNDLTPDFPPRELAIWQLDRKVNMTGVPVDFALCAGAVKILETAELLAIGELQAVTGGLVQTVGQVDKIKAFLESRGVVLANLQMGTLDALDMNTIADPAAKAVIRIRRESSLASVKKMKAAADWCDPDGRCRQALKYYAAGPGRWGGRGPQFQNLFKGADLTDAIKAERKRVSSLPKAERDYSRMEAMIEAALAVIASGDYAAAKAIARGGDVYELISNAVRAIIKAPPGTKLDISDFAAIECRVLHWLVGDEPLLKLFREGGDVYVGMACQIFNVEREKILDPKTDKVWEGNKEANDQRAVGKVARLGCGYQMAGPRFQENVLDKAGLQIPLEFAEQVVEVYRANNPLVVNLWRDVQDAAMYVVKNADPRNPETITVGRVSFRMEYRGKHRWMVIRLPSGRDLYYFNPRIAPGKFGPCVRYDSHKHALDLYGGLITENIVQGIARDLLCDALIRFDKRGGVIVLHVHDEIVGLSKLGDKAATDLLHKCMEEIEPWAGGCPVAAETHASIRYTK